MNELQIRLRAALERAEALNIKPSRSEEESAALKSVVAEARDLKAAIERAQELGEIKDFAGKSAGFLPLATGAAPGQVTVEGTVPAGSTTLATNGKGGFKTIDDEGFGFVDDKQLAILRAPEYKAAFRSYLRGGLEGLTRDAIKTLQGGSDTQGGFLVPEDILSRIIAKTPAPTNVAGRVTQLQTSRDALIIPKVNYTTDDIFTTGMRVTWTGEVPSSSTVHRVTEPVFGQIRIPVHTAMMSMPISNDMIDDAAFPIVSWSSSKFSETIDLLKDNMILSGSGIGQPNGILQNPGGLNQPAIIQAGVGAGPFINADFVESLAWSLPPQYDDNAAFVMNKTNTGQAFAKLKDSNGRYLWGAGLQDSGIAPSLKNRVRVGYDVLFNQLMPNISNGGFPVIFGDLMGYFLLNRVGFSIQVLRELYAETNQVLLLGRLRIGGQVAEDWRLKIGQSN
jgi:HK97 family phage major capsid protein